MVSDEDMEALEKLKSTQEIIYSSLEAELTTLKSRYQALEIKSEQEHRHLVEAIIVKDRLTANEAEQQSVLSKIQASVPIDSGNDLQKELAEKTEKANQNLKSDQEVMDKLIKSLYSLSRLGYGKKSSNVTASSQSQDTILEAERRAIGRSSWLRAAITSYPRTKMKASAILRSSGPRTSTTLAPTLEGMGLTNNTTPVVPLVHSPSFPTSGPADPAMGYPGHDYGRSLTSVRFPLIYSHTTSVFVAGEYEFPVISPWGPTLGNILYC